ncbi:MAG: RluA family pseudouridine synthase [Candidatus Saccharimonadales bacterium]
MEIVPFYPNHEDGMHCMLAAYRSVIAYFLHRELTWDELEELTGYTLNRAAWTIKALVDMQDMGLDIRMIEPFDYRRYLKEGEPYLHELYSSEEVEWYLANSNVKDIQSFIPKFLERVKYVCRRARMADIDSMLNENRLVFVTVNAQTLNDMEGFTSHALLVIGREGNDFVAHDSGGKLLEPTSNRIISRKKLWEAMGGENNTAEVTGFKLKSPKHNKRLDIYVVEQQPSLSRAYAAKLIEQGKVLVNGQPSKSGYKLREIDEISIDFTPEDAARVPKIDLPVLYEDDDCIVINKPVGILSHSKGSFNPEATVSTFVRDRIKGLEGERAGIVHRLDRATSGVIICAKHPEALSWFQKQFAQRKVKKLYEAITTGQLVPAHAIIDMPIERNPKAPATFRVGPNGKSALTEYEVIKTSGHYSQLQLRPQTGRTHQLRVHLSHQGHPIVGDVLYGGEPADRLFLHAYSLEITLPNRERKTFTAPLPKEFNEKMKEV